ncbi:MAG TPA: hypothetical protein VLC09_12780 [Polyangiaceae bacterium]|nr:hypothetical protein [Polyangiaceae bacterium]
MSSMGVTSHTWLLNPDAESELRSPRGPNYTAPASVVRSMLAQRALFAPLLQGEPGCFIAELTTTDAHDHTLRGPALLWCPTPSAQRAARRAGYSLPPAPEPDVLRRAMSRRLLAESSLPAPPGRCFVTSEEALEVALAPVFAGELWRAKPAYSFASRGQRKLSRHHLELDRRFLSDALRHGGLLLEPELELQRELSIHGLVRPSESPLLGSPCVQALDEFGQPLRVDALESLDERDGRDVRSAELRLLGEQAAATLAHVGYFGPFGLDVLEDRGGNLWASDLNARFTLGWSTGMAAARAEALAWLLRAHS